VLFGELAEIEGVPVRRRSYRKVLLLWQPSLPQRPSPPRHWQERPPPAPLEQVHVVMYCTDWCPACRRARAYLKVNNIPFEEVNITRDRAAAATVRSMTGGEFTPHLMSVEKS
jgi:glutaredoxin